VLGIALGGASIAVLIAIPPSGTSVVVVCYLLFGYPIYALLETIQKGIILSHGGVDHLLLHVRRPEYLKKLVALNHPVVI